MERRAFGGKQLISDGCPATRFMPKSQVNRDHQGNFKKMARLGAGCTNQRRGAPLLQGPCPCQPSPPVSRRLDQVGSSSWELPRYRSDTKFTLKEGMPPNGYQISVEVEEANVPVDYIKYIPADIITTPFGLAWLKPSIRCRSSYTKCYHQLTAPYHHLSHGPPAVSACATSLRIANVLDMLLVILEHL